MMTENVYNAAPYPVLSHSDTHPDKAATIATLLGLNPPPVTNCRVLELGCASGGNIMPMAETLRNSTFVGVDYAEKQIEQARERAQNLSLNNIRFEAMDILDIDADFGEFDYIIAHGVYSWVPEDVRDYVLHICKQNLSPNGIAYISYNTYPGWHSLMVVRDLMLWHNRNAQTAEQRMEAAFNVTAYLTETMLRTGHNPAYASYLEHYMQKRFTYDKEGKPQLETSLLHDEMEAVNQPVYFHEFHAHAQEHDLQYVAETPFVQVLMPDIPVEAQQHFSSLSSNLVEMEQYIDYVRHRTFRRTLLTHANITIERKLNPKSVMQFYIASRANVVDDPDAVDGIERFADSDKMVLSINHPVSKAAMHHLIETAATLSFDELFDVACERLQLENPPEQDRHILAANLLQGYTSSTELVEFFSYNPGIVTTVSDKPRARTIARLDALNHDLPHTTNLKHERMILDPFIRLILPYLDGQHDRDAILDKLVEHVVAGRINVRTKDGERISEANARAMFTGQLDVALKWLGRSSLLTG
jgi:methyltransferase-like protein/SAM-dependent methyltransferase